MSRDVVAMFAATDRNDADGFIAHLAPDVKYVFANSEPVIGRETVKKNTIAFWGTMDGVVHHICRIHEVGDTVIVEFDMEYRRKDGTTVHVPCCDVLTYDGDLISEFQIYIDLKPLYD